MSSARDILYEHGMQSWRENVLLALETFIPFCTLGQCKTLDSTGTETQSTLLLRPSWCNLSWTIVLISSKCLHRPKWERKPHCYILDLGQVCDCHLHIPHYPACPGSLIWFGQCILRPQCLFVCLGDLYGGGGGTEFRFHITKHTKGQAVIHRSYPVLIL